MKAIINNAIYVKDLDACIENIVDFEKLRNKTVLITGATGLIGSFLVDVLYRANETKKLNVTMYALARSIERLQKRFFYLTNCKKVIFVEQDVTEKLKIKDISIDYCIHAASNAYPAAMYNDPVGTIMANMVGTYNLLEYLTINHGKRFLFVSTGEVYGKTDKQIEIFRETSNGIVDILEVRSCYPLSKRCAENLCISYQSQYKLETVIVRPCHTYGANNTQADNRANVQFINNAVDGKDIVLKSKGQQLRSYSYIADTCSGLLTVLISGKNGEAYNLSNNLSTTTIFGFAEKVATQAGVQLLFDANDDQTSPFDRAVLDSSKLEKLGWKGRYSIDKGIENTLNISRWLKC